MHFEICRPEIIFKNITVYVDAHGIEEIRMLFIFVVQASLSEAYKALHFCALTDMDGQDGHLDSALVDTNTTPDTCWCFSVTAGCMNQKILSNQLKGEDMLMRQFPQGVKKSIYVKVHEKMLQTEMEDNRY